MNSDTVTGCKYRGPPGILIWWAWTVTTSGGLGISYFADAFPCSVCLSFVTHVASHNLAPARDSTHHFRNVGCPRRRGYFGRSQKFPERLHFCCPLTSQAYPSLRGYRRAETADGPRRRQSVLQMRAQMLQSLFLAPCTAPSSRCSGMGQLWAFLLLPARLVRWSCHVDTLHKLPTS